MRTALFAMPLTAVLALSACSADKKEEVSSLPKGPLTGVCPANVVIQTDWFATTERAAVYQLIGPNGKIDAKKGTYSGPLGTSGVSVEVRLGGPFLGGQPTAAQLYQDKSILLAAVSTDAQIKSASKFATTAVVTPLERDPQIIMWDPATYKIKTWADVKATKAKILYSQGRSYVDVLLAKNLVTKDQLDGSFDGTPSRFVAEGGKVIQQGYASNEPYRWENDVANWKKPVDYLLVADADFPIYAQSLAVRTSELEKNKPCLERLVPLIQQAEVDYITNPGPMNEALVKIAQTVQGGPPVTLAGNESGVKVQKELKLVGNGSDATLGNFDTARIDASIALLGPIFKAQGLPVPDALKAADLVTNDFIDPSIKL